MEQAWRFGPYTLWAQRRRLEREGELVRLGARAFDMLHFLVDKAGEVVHKDALLSNVWRGLVVEESCVRVQMYLVRKALGAPPPAAGIDDWIANVPTLGYSFVAPVERIDGVAAEVAGLDNADGGLASPQAIPSVLGTASDHGGDQGGSDPTSLKFQPAPLRMSPIVGREQDLARLDEALTRHRLVTVVGTGGVGKTSLATHAVQGGCRPDAPIAFVDLAPLASGTPVASALMMAFGAPAATRHPVPWLKQVLENRSLLLLVDNCEHVIDGLRPLLGELLLALPGLRILATSREPIRLDGEYVLRLAPLQQPSDLSDAPGLEALLKFPAVALLHERLLAAGAAPMRDQHAGLLARIVRHVDGIPLAIELVASQAATRPLPHIARQLDEHLGQAAGPEASARHRSLTAVLDWSVRLLDEIELRALRRLTVFRAGFDAEAALTVLCNDGDLGPEAAQAVLASLVSKSLVCLDVLEERVPYRLLETTRSYGEALLALTADVNTARARHLAWVLDGLAIASEELEGLAPATWGERYSGLLDDVRAALAWAFSASGDLTRGVQLTLASSPLWFHVSQVEEYAEHLARAIEAVQAGRDGGEHLASLYLCRGQALWHVYGYSLELIAMFRRGLEQAKAKPDVDLQLHALWGLCTGSLQGGDYLAARQSLEDLRRLGDSTGAPLGQALAARLQALVGMFNGEFTLAVEAAQSVLMRSDLGRRSTINAQLVDGRVAVWATQARLLWLSGETQRAIDVADNAVNHALKSGHSLTLCFALFGACPVALWAKDLERARKWCRLMLDDSLRRGLIVWHRWAMTFEAARQRLEHLAQGGAAASWLMPPIERPECVHLEMLASFDPAWLCDEVITRAWCGESGWIAAEVWRLLGVRHETRGEFDEAERLYEKALTHARAQGGTSWEARALHSLARMHAARGQADKAVQLLEGGPGRGDAGPYAPDVAACRDLMNQLREAV